MCRKNRRSASLRCLLACVALLLSGFAVPTYEELCSQGRRHLEQKHFDSAVDVYTRAVKTSPDQSLAYVGRALACREKSDFPKAAADLCEAIRIDPKCQLALEVRAGIYERLGDPQKAEADRRTLSHLRAAARPTGTWSAESSRTTIFDPLRRVDGRTTGAGSTGKDSPASAAALMADLARRNIEAEKQTARDAQQAVEKRDAKILAPDQWRAANEAMAQAQALAEKGEYERAAQGYRAAQQRLSETMQAVDQALAGSPDRWFKLAWQKAELVTDTTKKAVIWTTLAEASRQVGGNDRYTQAVEKAVSAAKSSAIVDPSVGIRSLLAVADVRYRSQDAIGALACVREAVTCCQGIEDAEVRANRLARCAGYFARFGHPAGWDSAMERVSQTIDQYKGRGGYVKQTAPFSTKCIAYCEAGDWQQAFAQARAMEGVVPPEHRPKNPDYYAVEYAKVAFAAAQFGSAADSGREVFEKAYVAACADLARFGHWKESRCPAARFWLARADAALGASDRAWIAAVHLPNAADRVIVAADSIRRQVELKRYDNLERFLAIIPPEVAASPVIRWIAEAETRAGKKSMAELKRWATEMEPPEHSAAALAGIGAGTKNRELPLPTRDDVPSTVPSAASQGPGEAPSGPAARQDFGKAAATTPVWWIDQAIGATRATSDSLTRASLWLRIASTQAEVGDRSGYRKSMEQARRSAVATWESMCFEQKRDRSPSEVSFRPRFVSGGMDANGDRIGAIIETLFEIEAVHHQQHETRQSIDTLFCALRCAEVLHRFPGEFYSMKVWTPRVWMARIAGRFRLRDRPDLADLMFVQGPWDPAAKTEPDASFAVALIEAEDERGIQQQAARFQQERAGAGSAATALASLAVLAAHKGDADAFRKNAMTVSGLTKARRYPASRAVLLELARGAALLGETDLARQYVEQSGTGGSRRDAALAEVIEQMALRKQLAETRALVDGLKDGQAKVRARYAIARAEAANPSANMQTLYEDARSYPTSHERAAALAGVAAGAMTKGGGARAPAGERR